MYPCKELLLTHMVILLSWCHALALKGNGSAILQQDSTQANTTGIADDFKGPVQIRSTEAIALGRCWGFFVLQRNAVIHIAHWRQFSRQFQGKSVKQFLQCCILRNSRHRIKVKAIQDQSLINTCYINQIHYIIFSKTCGYFLQNALVLPFRCSSSQH